MEVEQVQGRELNIPKTAFLEGMKLKECANKCIDQWEWIMKNKIKL
jgi:hypothetical protein